MATAAAAGKRLAGKIAIVTGGASGFGAAIVKRFVQEGAKVCVADMDVTNARPLAAEMSNTIMLHEMNVTRKSDWDSLVEKVRSKHGQIDCLVNNAGTTHTNKPTVEVTEEEFDLVFQVNVKGIFFGVNAIIPQLLQNKNGGSIINMASIGSQRPRPGLTWYNSSKAAVTNATQSLAAEYGPNQIRVNALCPLLSGTRLFPKFVGVEDTPENRKKYVSNVPMGRLSEPLDIANAALYLASDEASFVTGTSMLIDGGKAV